MGSRLQLPALARRIGLLQAPTVTAGHVSIGAAAVLGFSFAVAHLATVIITCATVGFGWGVNAWMFDMMGFFAGFLFACLCKKASNTCSAESRKELFWILVWSGITLGVRVLDVLMLFGIVRIDDIYHAPSGAVLYANIVSEIVIAIPYTLLALVGSLMLLLCPKDGVSEGAPPHEGEAAPSVVVNALQ